MSKVLKRLYLGDVVKSFGAKQLRKLTTEEPTESIVGTWVLNKELTAITGDDISFECVGGFYSYTSAYMGYISGDIKITLSASTNYYTVATISGYPSAKTYYTSAGAWKCSYRRSSSNSTYDKTLSSDSDIVLAQKLIITDDSNITSNEARDWLKANATKQ